MAYEPSYGMQSQNAQKSLQRMLKKWTGKVSRIKRRKTHLMEANISKDFIFFLFIFGDTAQTKQTMAYTELVQCKLHLYIFSTKNKKPWGEGVMLYAPYYATIISCSWTCLSAQTQTSNPWLSLVSATTCTLTFTVTTVEKKKKTRPHIKSTPAAGGRQLR